MSMESASSSLKESLPELSYRKNTTILRRATIRTGDWSERDGRKVKAMGERRDAINTSSILARVKSMAEIREARSTRDQVGRNTYH
jgi:hypothetical protein